MKTKCALVLSVLGPLIASRNASAQSATLDWIANTAAGGTSTGGVYSVSASIGQPGAGAISGANYSVVGGFWAIDGTTPPPGAPALRIRLSDTGDLILAWPSAASGFQLEESGGLVTPSWSDVDIPPVLVGDEQEVLVPRPISNTFYRLRKPVE
jgi:hypothetical protein